jgi:hypothetical protein
MNRECSMHGEKIVYKISVGKPGGKKPLGRHRRKWEDPSMDLREIVGWGSMDWINLAYDSDQKGAVVNTLMNFPVP